MQCYAVKLSAAYDAALRSLDEVDNLADYVGLLELGLNILESLCGVHLAKVEAAIDILGLGDLGCGVSVPFETDDVEPLESGRLSAYHRERRDILAEACAALHHCVAPDAGELVAERASAYDGEVRALNLASELASVRHYDVVAENAIVANMAIGHNEVVVSDDGLVS